MKAHRRVVRVESKRLDSQTLARLACVASVPIRSERNSGHAKDFFAFGLCEKWGESERVEGRGWARGKKGTLARKPLDFEKPIGPRTGLLIVVAWSS